jgi:hypothetical protein
MTTIVSANAKKRFEKKFLAEPMSGCWLWEASSGSKKGYGAFYLGGGRNNRTQVNAQRAAWFLYRGDPGDLHVLHKCDNPACVNPDHLFLGTNADNVHDMDAKGRRRTVSRSAEFLRGSDHPISKLTNSDVIAIRCSTDPQAKLGARFGVSQSLIHRIKTGKSWAWLPPVIGDAGTFIARVTRR